jgi:transposase
MHVSSSTKRNRAGRNDARGIAHLVGLGSFNAVHIKCELARRLRMLCGCRNLVVRKLVDTAIETR